MTRILTMIAAIAILILLVLWLRNPDPADETDLPAVDAPNVSLESNTAPEDADLDVAAPRETDPALESEPMDVEVVRDSEGRPEVGVGVPEGEGQIDGEVDETEEDPLLEADEQEDDAQPERG
jgi:hypothetical protein